MGFDKDLFFLFTCCFLLLEAESKCQQSYPCSNFTLEFPFTDAEDTECGLFPVFGCNLNDEYRYPRADIGYGHYIDILGKPSENRFSVEDFYFQGLLNSRSCFAFTYKSPLMSNPSVSFTFSSNLTFFTCSKEPYITEHFKDYQIEDCDAFNVFYKNPVEDSSDYILHECTVVQLPKSNVNDSADLFDLLSSKFILEWGVSEACFKCYRGGGQCLNDSQNTFFCKQGNRIFRNKILITGGVTTAVFASISIILILFIGRKYTLLRLFAFEKPKLRNEKDIELFLKNNENLAPKRYKYSDIKKMTNSFKKNLGKGGYGSVYEGKLPDGHPVAVKMLDESKGNGEEFMNEVASISRTSHVNIVSLLGFCFEGCKRALIYEFMPNGSLEKFISNPTSSAIEGRLGWQKLLEIALGIARGLDYLHQGCKTRILHFDIKPHNILLDNDFNPRISDFGLARLCPNRSSIVSMMEARGTIGYIAPEVFCRNFGEVSHKSDVYSYGMMVLEIAGGKKNIDRADVDRTSETYFPDYIYKQLEMDGNGDVTLVEIMNEDESRIAKRKLIIVGLWCIQTDPKNRPSMSKVVEMLEGKLESLHVPPKPNVSSPPRSAPKFSTSRSI